MAKKAEIKETKKTEVKPASKKEAAKSVKKETEKAGSKKEVKPVKVVKEKAEKPEVKKVVSAKATVKKEVKKEPELKKEVKKEPVEKKEVKMVVEKKKTQNIEEAKPAPKEKRAKTYSKKELEEFKKVILEKRNEIIEQLQALKEQMMDPTTGQYVNENSPYSLHMAEQGTDSQEREKLYLWAQRENKFLGYLEEALQRIENGTYGLCLECIEDPKYLCPTCPLVPKERLMAVPHTQMCVQVKSQQGPNKK